MLSSSLFRCGKPISPWYWLTAIAAVIAGNADPAQGRGVYVFGDSSAEQGNLYALPGQSRAGSSYYAPDGFSRESNGPIWTEYLFAGIKPVLDPTHRPDRINFAFSGATSGRDNIAVDEAGGLSQQVALFRSGVASGSLKPKSDDVFVVAAGVNDFFRDLSNNGDLTRTTQDVPRNLTAAVKELSKAGAGLVLVEDIPNFWHAPAFRGLPADQDKMLLQGIETVTGVASAEIRKQLAEFRTANPQTNVAVVPVRALFDHIRDHAAELGFTNIDQACYDPVAETLCSTDPKVQNGYLFFDDLHLTTRGQELQAKLYGALLDTLDGRGNLAAAEQADSVSEAAGTFIAMSRSARRTALVGEAASRRGIKIVGDYSHDWRQGRADGAGARSRSDLDAMRLGVGLSDGKGWHASVSGARFDGKRGGDGHMLSYRLKGNGVMVDAQRDLGGLVIGASASKIWSDVKDGKRETGVPLLVTEFQTTASIFSAEAEVGYRLHEGDWTVFPALGIGYQRLRIEGYSETAAKALALKFEPVRDDNARATAGLYATHAPWRLGGLNVQPALDINVERRLDDAKRSLRSTLIDNVAAPVVLSASASDKWVAAVEPSLAMGSGPLRVQVAYRRELRPHDHVDRFKAGVLLGF